VVNTDTENIDQYGPDFWNDSDELPQEALDFMEVAEKEGRVFSLKGFMVAFNDNNEISSETDWVFATNKY